MSVLLLINPINVSMAQESSTEPKITDCGKMGCDYFVGKHFMLGDVGDYSMTNASRLPKPAKKIASTQVFLLAVGLTCTT